MSLEQIGLIAFGAGLGFFFSIIGQQLTYRHERESKIADDEIKRKNLFTALLIEIETGMNRATGLVRMISEEKISFSRIFTPFWESAIGDLINLVKDENVIRPIFVLYYRFNLINFNMDQMRFGSGAAFAETYIVEMNQNIKDIKKWCVSKGYLPVSELREIEQVVGITETE